MGRGSMYGKMVEDMKESIWMTKNMEVVNIIGQMEKYFKETGSMAKEKGKE